jgi:hypothetical protein
MSGMPKFMPANCLWREMPVIDMPYSSVIQSVLMSNKYGNI